MGCEMVSKLKGRNRYQKAAQRPGKTRVGRAQIAELLEMARSEDPRDRRVAAQYLCPCHVRRRIDEVWAALYRMLEDSDLQVRRAAWHTLEDGGRPSDPTLGEIFARARVHETDSTIRNYLSMFTGSSVKKKVEERLLAYSEFFEVGKCDFCGGSNLKVKWELETLIPIAGEQRLALICERCSATQT